MKALHRIALPRGFRCFAVYALLFALQNNFYAAKFVIDNNV